MAFVGQVNIETEGLGFAAVMFRLKSAMLDAGWQLMSAGFGNSASYQPGKGALIASSVGTQGLDGTGSGGGGGAWSSNSNNRRASGKGGSGVCIVRYENSSSIEATGGSLANITQNDTQYKVHVFTESSDFEVTSGSGQVEYLIVGGGGSGGLYGGGSGGQIQSGVITVAQQIYPIVVGIGGASVPGGSGNTPGNNGLPSSAFGVSAAGGAGGLGQYNSSTNLGPGGEGAGGSESNGNGGRGLVSLISGTPLHYSAGGGSASGNASVIPGKGGFQGVWLSSPNPDGSPLSVEQDPLDSPSSCSETNAWFRIREPEHSTPNAPRREFVFLRGTDNNRILIKYSRATGFTVGGFIDEAPTTGEGGDGVVVSDSTTLDLDAIDRAAATLFSNVTLGKYLHIVLDNVNDYGANGGFPFWVWTSRQATGFADWAMVHENVAPGTTSSLDQDPTYRVCTPTLANFFTATGVRGNWWEAYGLADPILYRNESVRFCHQIHGLSWSPSVQRFAPSQTTLGFSPYEGQVIFYPLMVGIPGALFKGYSTGVTCSGFTQHNILDVFKITTSNPRVLVYLDPNQRVSVFFPWLPNELPLTV